MGLLTDYYGQLGQLVAAPERKSISTLSMASPQDSQFARRAKDAIQNTTAYQNISHAINQPIQQVSDLYALLSGQGGQEEADRYVDSIGQGLMGMGGSVALKSPYVILKNPSKAEASVLLGKARFNDVRGVVDPHSKDVFIADANMATHKDMADLLGISWDDLLDYGSGGRFISKNAEDPRMHGGM